MINISDKFIANINDFSKSDFTISDFHQTKRCLLDYLGATMAGAQLLQNKCDVLLNELGVSSGNIPIIGSSKCANLERAAFFNGLNSHIAELDDGIISGIVHPGAPILSALIPYAIKESVEGYDFLRGIIIGYEVAARLADTIQPSHKLRGYHATATCGSVGAALAIGSMMKFSSTEMKNTFSIAIISAFGTLKVLEESSELKPYNVAQAAQIAVLAASMAKAQFNGPEDVLSGNTGFFSMLSDEQDMHNINFTAEDVKAIHKVYVKPYAACRYCHPGIDAALNLRKKYTFNIEDINVITVETYALAVKNHDQTNIENVSSAKMSIPYSVAVSLVTGKAGLIEFSEQLINDEVVVQLAKKVKVIASEEFTTMFPEKSPARLSIEMKTGETFSEIIFFPKGEPQTKLSDSELIDKFDFLVRSNKIFSRSPLSISNTVWDIEENMAAFVKILKTPVYD